MNSLSSAHRPFAYRGLAALISTALPAIAASLLLASCAKPADNTASSGQNAAPPVFDTSLPMTELMDHVLTPAAFGVWAVGGYESTPQGDHYLAPKTDEDWENVESFAATLKETTNLLRIPARVPDPRWNQKVDDLDKIATQALDAAQKHDLKTLNNLAQPLDNACEACHKIYAPNPKSQTKK